MRTSKKNYLKEAGNLQDNHFASKIKSLDQIIKLVGKKPKGKPRQVKVVMCHGTFDIVHPGHLRQLIYAKSKGGESSKLIVSITTDKHVTKGPLRPYVPQELRALNLAAFQIVDYVIIDKNPTPIENILKIKPDLFVKGFEYSLDGINPKTQEEITALESYGGEMVFSPGDVVYSSTQLLNLNRPNLAVEKLTTLMQAEGITFKSLHSALKKSAGKKIHVIGDLIVDKYSHCTLLGQAQKAPAFSARLDKTNLYVGGAGIVAKQLASMGASVTLTTILGEDKEAEFALNDLKNSGVKVNKIIDPSRPTIVKERFLNETMLLLQVNRLDNSSINEKILSRICRYIKKTDSDAIVLSDFRHGIFNQETIPSLISSVPPYVIKIADSQVSNRWGNILDFKGFDLITPNEREARFALGDQDTTIRPLAQKLYIQSECKYLILKLGSDGIIVYKSPGGETREYYVMDSFATTVSDPVGAGDALLAGSTLGLVSTKNILISSIIGNICAGIECSKIGNIPITIQEIHDQLKRFEENY